MSDLPANDADELEVKKRARRRLVGAVVLALLAAILLPLAMEGEAPPAVPDMQVSIPPRADAPPSADERTEDGKLDIEPDTDANAPVPTAPAPAPSAPAPTVSAPTTAVPNAVSAAQPVPSEPPLQPVAPSAKPKPAREPGHEKPAAKPAAKPGADVDPVLALLGSGGEPSRPAATNADGGKGRVYVQVGAFSDAGRADALVNELKKQGFAAYAEQAGKVNRVRIGPLSKSESTRTVARLKAKGRKAVVVSR